MKAVSCAVFTFILGVSSFALAADTHMMEGHGMAEVPTMQGAMDKMNREMASVPVTGDPDRDFAAMMIPHHQGAIDMARAYLQTGKDHDIRKLAEGIISAQEGEIRFLREYLAGKGGKTP